MQECTIITVKLYGVVVHLWKGSRNSTNAQLILQELRTATGSQQQILAAPSRKNIRNSGRMMSPTATPRIYRKYCSRLHVPGPGSPFACRSRFDIMHMANQREEYGQRSYFSGK